MKRIEIQYKNKLVVIPVDKITSIRGSFDNDVPTCEIHYPGGEQLGVYIYFEIIDLLKFIDGDQQILSIKIEN